jgi:predicted PurR-regulated permease PerM
MTEHIRRAGQVAWAAMGIAAVLVVFGAVAWFIRVVWPPLIFAGAIVFILNPVVTFLQRRGVPRAAGAGLSYLGVLGAIGFGGLLLSPLVSDQVDQFRDKWPEVQDNVDRWIDDREADCRGRWCEFDRDDLDSAFSTSDLTFDEQLDRLRDIGVRVLHVVLILIIGPVIAFYMLVDLPHIRRVLQSLVPERARPEVLLVSRRLGRAIGGFFRGQLFVALIVGILCSIGLAIIDLPFWLLIGMIAGLFNIVPLIGPWIGAIPGVIVALTTRDIGTAIWVAVVMAGVQQVDNHFITPTVMQRAVRVHPAVVILALLAGGTQFGFPGLLLAVPAVAVLKIILGHVWRVHVLGEPFEDVVAAAAREETQDRGGAIDDIVSVATRPENEPHASPGEATPTAGARQSTP